MPSLRRGYKGLAATPTSANLVVITASVFWVSNVASLVKFNDFLLSMSLRDGKKIKEYYAWLRPFACCANGGFDPDENGKGIKPFAVNEMTMLGYYHFLYPTEFLLLPVLPRHDYLLHKFWSNLTTFAIGGDEVGPDTGPGIWDGASYGQRLGGTNRRHGNDIGFTDGSHIVGQAITTNKCIPVMLCSNVTTAVALSIQPQTTTTTGTSIATATAIVNTTVMTTVTQTERNDTGILGIEGQTGYSNFCYTAPYVRCGNDTNYTPIHNIHVHSKNLMKFRSVLCNCG